MEELYKSLISGTETLMAQLQGHLFGMTEPEGPVLILVDHQRQYRLNHPGRAGFLQDDPDILSSLCEQIDDGYDPCVYAVEGGVVIGTQLATETTDCGYLLIFIPGYLTETVQENMDLFEIILAQTQVICHLLEKNNQFHHAQLSGLSKQSALLC